MPAKPLETATMKMPSAKITRSPARLIMRPQNGAVTRRIRANTETTAPTARLSTPKLRAKTCNTGINTPKPTATQNAISPSTMTSRGIRVERSRRSQLGAGGVAFTANSLPARRPVVRTPKAGGVGYGGGASGSRTRRQRWPCSAISARG